MENIKIKIYQKEYYEKNKEYFKLKDKKRTEQKKIYYQKIKDKLNTKFDCICGGKYTNSSKLKHTKTKKHLSYSSVKKIN